jgi:hypothetical protein
MDGSMNTGGPAFPVWEVNDRGYPEMLDAGMTLRDYFAAKALHYALKDCFTTDGAVEQAYEIADAMLEARKQ